MSNVWKMIQDKKGNRQTHAKKKHKQFLVPSQRYRDSRHILQNPTVPNYVMGFSDRTQRFTGPNYLDVDNPFKILCLLTCPVPPLHIKKFDRPYKFSILRTNPTIKGFHFT